MAEEKEKAVVPAPRVLAELFGTSGTIRIELLPTISREGEGGTSGGENEGLQDLTERVASLEQSRASDIADTVRKSELFSEEHTTILPELLPDPEIKWIKGVGRPDKPETTRDAIIGDEEDCTRYLSTDGAGVGAYEWEKRGGVWHVVRGDTGWRELKGDNKAYIGNIRIRRAGGACKR